MRCSCAHVESSPVAPAGRLAETPVGRMVPSLAMPTLATALATPLALLLLMSVVACSGQQAARDVGDGAPATRSVLAWATRVGGSGGDPAALTGAPTGTLTGTLTADRAATGAAAPSAPVGASAQAQPSVAVGVTADATSIVTAGGSAADPITDTLALGPISDATSDAISPAGATQTARALDAMSPPDLFRTAEAHEAGGQTEAAIDAYDRYGLAEPSMADVAAMGVGNALFAAGRFEDAAIAFTQARDKAGDPTTAFLASLRRGNAMLRTGPADAAIAAYHDAFERAMDDAGRSQALAGEIAALVDDDRMPEAYALRRRLVHELPSTTLAGGALTWLDRAGEEVPLADRAAVAAGAGDHPLAIAFYQQAIEEASVARGSGSLALARSYKALGQHSNTVALVDAFLASHARDAAAIDLAWRRAEALSRLGRDADAADAYLDLSIAWPHSTTAPEALHRRALMVESNEGIAAGAEALDDLRARYPNYDGALDALLRSGLLHFQLGNLPKAAERWFAAVDNGNPAQQANAWYWLGKAAAQGGDTELALQYYRAAMGADRDGFYGLRAAEWVGERLSPAPSGSGDVWADTAQWLSSWAGGPSPDARDAVLADVGASRNVQRASALLDLERRPSAGRTLRRALVALEGDPVAQAALAIHAADLGIHEVSIAAAVRVLNASGHDARQSAPLAVWRLAYPDAFGAQVRAEADRLDVPVDLMFALIRQESRFDPTALSPAGARGLAQVMPGTGAGIASALAEPDFEVADLLEPNTSVRYGVWYLDQQLERYDGRDWAALSAYNGGPGNAQRWLAASGGDRDLFAEIIDFRETRRYVKLVEEQRAQYARLYADVE